MKIIVYNAKDEKELKLKIKSIWQEFKDKIRTIAVKVLARLIQIYIVITSDDSPKNLKLASKLLPVGALILFDITLKSFPYASLLGFGAYALYKSIKKTMNAENYQIALQKAKNILGGYDE